MSINSDCSWFPKAEGLFIHTGSIVNWNRLKKKLTQKPTEELSECISSTVEAWKSQVDYLDIQFAKEIECLNKVYIERIPAKTRCEYKLTAKVFLFSTNTDLLDDAISQVKKELGSDVIETVIVAMPESVKENLDTMLPIWSRLEELASDEQIGLLGISDLNATDLEALYDAAQVKPLINQVNLESCCVMPPDLVEYAKQNDIQLLTHNDPTEILSAEQFRAILGEHFSDRDVVNWQPSWIVRYSVLLKCRGIIKNKGYIMRAERNL